MVLFICLKIIVVEILNSLEVLYTEKGMSKTTNTPTANIKLDDDDKIKPADGVYAVLPFDNNILYGIMNIGLKPSIDINNKKTTEVHLFNFDKNIYNKSI